MAESIHTARWIGQLTGTGWELHLFPSRFAIPNRELPPLTLHTLFPIPGKERRHDLLNAPFLMWPFRRGQQQIANFFFPENSGASIDALRLAATIDRLNPDIVHTLEMQGAAYLMLQALPHIRNRERFKWIYSCWGNDIRFYQKDPIHLTRIQNVLENIDYCTADCERDLQSIKGLDPSVQALPVFPTGGGYKIADLLPFRSAGKISDRKIIALKGYHQDDWTGRALNALRALELCGHALDGFEVQIYRPSPCVSSVARYLKEFTQMKIRLMPSLVDNIEILRLLGLSRISISVNSGDGTPNAMLESMIMGAFPIQSSTADTSGWIDDGTNGFIVPYDNIEEIAGKIRRALGDDELVNSGAETSLGRVQERLQFEMIRERVIETYSNVCGS
jgi:hypothetical protein